MTDAPCLSSRNHFAHGVTCKKDSPIKSIVEGQFYEAMETGTVTFFVRTTNSNENQIVFYRESPIRVLESLERLKLTCLHHR